MPLTPFVDPPPDPRPTPPADVDGLLPSGDFADALAVRLAHGNEIVSEIYGPTDDASARIVSMIESELEGLTLRH